MFDYTWLILYETKYVSIIFLSILLAKNVLVIVTVCFFVKLFFCVILSNFTNSVDFVLGAYVFACDKHHCYTALVLFVLVSLFSC